MDDDALAWTTEKPTKPGWYWARHVPSNPNVSHIVHIRIGVTERLLMNQMGFDRALDVSSYEFDSGYEWAGPLKPPV